MNYISGKIALITGASSGIGKQLAFDLAKMDVNLILVSRNLDELKNIQNTIIADSKIEVDIYKLDVRDRNAVKNLFVKIYSNKNIDILINNAGLAAGLDNIDEGDIDDWEIMIDTNIKGLLYVSRAVIPKMKSLDTAHIVNISSVAGKITYPKGNVYCATKAAVTSLSEAMNIDLYGTNVKVTNIAPGAIETNFSNVRFKNDSEKADAVYDGYTPLTSKDISEIIINILNTPKHVNIQNVDIMPTAQRNPYLLYREN